jgi:hypothetical protein
MSCGTAFDRLGSFMGRNVVCNSQDDGHCTSSLADLTDT